MRSFRAAAAVGFLLLGVSGVGAQTTVDGTREVIANKARPGDRLTVTTAGGQRLEGRLLDLSADGLVLVNGGDKRSIGYRDVERVRRRRNGFLLGALIGAAAGVAAAGPVHGLSRNETSEAARDYALVVAGGAAVGLALDAALSRNRTIYRAPPAGRAALAVQPARGGASLNWRTTW